MKTIEEIKDPMVGKGVITNLADLLRTNDEGFTECEITYHAAVETLRAELPGESSPSLDEYLAACKSDVISGAAYAGYLGFRVNLENFHHPIGSTLSGWALLNTPKVTCSPISRSIITTQVREDFLKRLPTAFETLQNGIQDHFTRLECARPKLARYVGYIIINHILPRVEPGYREDYRQTMVFAAETEKYMGVLPL